MTIAVALQARLAVLSERLEAVRPAPAAPVATLDATSGAPAATTPPAVTSYAASALGGKPAASPTGPVATFSAAVTAANAAQVEPVELRNAVLQIVVDNFDYFRAHPPHLAWALMQFELIDRIARTHLDACHDNPKFSVEDACATLDAASDRALLYDAWALPQRNGRTFEDPGRAPPELGLGVANKTFDDWARTLTNPNNRYSGMYPDVRAVKDRILAVLGNGFGWSATGHACHALPRGTDEASFAGYTTAEADVRADLRAAILELRDHPMIAPHAKRYMERAAVYWTDNYAEHEIAKNIDLLREKCSEEGLDAIQTERAVAALRTVAYLERLIDVAKRWTPQQWADARMSSIWQHGGAAFDVSSITVETCSSVDTLLSTLSPDVEPLKTAVMNLREALWNAYVHRLDDKRHPDVLRAFRAVMGGSSQPGELTREEGYALLAAHKPNLATCAPLLERANAGDSAAAAELDRLTGVPAPGWDAVAHLALKEVESFLPFGGREDEDKPEPYYPLSSSSLLCTMPDNAHESYVRAGRELAFAIAFSNGDEPEESRRLAREFLARFPEPKAEPDSYRRASILRRPGPRQAMYRNRKL